MKMIYFYQPKPVSATGQYLEFHLEYLANYFCAMSNPLGDRY